MALTDDEAKYPTGYRLTSVPLSSTPAAVIDKNHRQALVTLIERKSRLTLIAKVTRKTAEAVSSAIIELLNPLSSWVRTLTTTNGKEFARHEHIADKLKAKFFLHILMHHGSGV